MRTTHNFSNRRRAVHVQSRGSGFRCYVDVPDPQGIGFCDDRNAATALLESSTVPLCGAWRGRRAQTAGRISVRTLSKHSGRRVDRRVPGGVCELESARAGTYLQARPGGGYPSDPVLWCPLRPRRLLKIDSSSTRGTIRTDCFNLVQLIFPPVLCRASP